MNLIKASSLSLGDPNITSSIGLLLFLPSVLSRTLACFSLLSQVRVMKRRQSQHCGRGFCVSAVRRRQKTLILKGK